MENSEEGARKSYKDQDLLLDSAFYLIIPFRQRHVGVSLHRARGLLLLDPAGQKAVANGRVRLYLARDNELILLLKDRVQKSLEPPKSERQAWLAVRAYESFLNPSKKRPRQLDVRWPPSSLDQDESTYAFQDGYWKDCPECDGTGRDEFDIPCGQCRGSGLRYDWN